jgi:hypothetical protein
MAQASVQYTPVQVLQAARRAEAEGKMDYALQFYRHIVEHHGTAAEAQEAREGLFRIAEWRWGEARIARRQEAATGYAGGQQRMPAQGAPNAQPAYAPEPGYTPEPADASVPVTGATRMPQIISREAAKAAQATAQPEFQPRFRGARSLAQFMSACGWVSMLAGIAVAGLATIGAMAEVSAGVLLGLPLGVLLGVPATLIGLVLVVNGQLAVAVFEGTNATLELAANGRRRPG